MTSSKSTTLSLAALAPGLAAAALAIVVARTVHHFVPQASAFAVAVLLGAMVGNLPTVPSALIPGTTFAAKRLLRVGIVLLGFRLALANVLEIGATGLLIVAVVTAATFFGTQWFGRRLGLSSSLSLLIATGYSICGVSAILAVAPVSGAKSEEVGFSVGLVTMFGTIAMIVLPILAGPLGLDVAGGAFGAWVGASVHDVAQVVASASIGGGEALESAVIVKLTRVVLLAPLVAGVSLARRRALSSEATSARPPIVPFFVLAFLGAILVRSTGWIPESGLASIQVAEKLLLTAALFGLGMGIRIAKLRHVGGPGLALGAIAWVVIAAIGYVAVRVAGLG